MEVKELRGLNAQELDEKIASLTQQLFELRRKKAVGQLENAEQLATLRKDIAKAKTIQRERELQIKRPGDAKK
jgi:large subunit ribosomal protein L29